MSKGLLEGCVFVSKACSALKSHLLTMVARGWFEPKRCERRSRQDRKDDQTFVGDLEADALCFRDIVAPDRDTASFIYIKLRRHGAVKKT